MNHSIRLRQAVSLAVSMVALLGWGAAHSDTVEDDFTGASAAVGWKVFGGACLTAGDGTGTVPACVGNPAYAGQTLVGGAKSKLPDVAGSGALRLTNGRTSYHATGAIVSPTPFPSNQGLDITFTTVTYGGDNDGGHGADGMSFFLVDGARKFSDVGTTGGVLGYACAHFDGVRADGISGGYLGLGIDEYGNFLADSNSGNGFGTPPVPGRIGLRGAGNVSWAALNASYPSFYPPSLSSSAKLAAVEKTCASGTIWNYNHSPIINTGIHVASYPAIVGGDVVLPSSTPLAAEAATTRTAARPIAYKLKLTQDGLLSFSYSYNGGSYLPVLTNTSIASLSPDNAVLPATFSFGFAASIGDGDNVHEILCFKAAPADIASDSAGGNIQPTGQLKTGTQIYLAFGHAENAWGQLTSKNLTYDPITTNVAIAPIANWDGNCTLTGGRVCVDRRPGCASSKSGQPHYPELEYFDVWRALRSKTPLYRPPK